MFTTEDGQRREVEASIEYAKVSKIQDILSWCPLTWHIYIVYNILCLNISSIFIIYIKETVTKKFLHVALTQMYLENAIGHWIQTCNVKS